MRGVWHHGIFVSRQNIKEWDTHVSRKSCIIQPIRWWLRNSWSVSTFMCRMNNLANCPGCDVTSEAKTSPRVLWPTWLYRTISNRISAQHHHNTTIVTSHQNAHAWWDFLTHLSLHQLLWMSAVYICSSKYSWHKYLQSSETTHTTHESEDGHKSANLASIFKVYQPWQSNREIEAK